MGVGAKQPVEDPAGNDEVPDLFVLMFNRQLNFYYNFLDFGKKG